jgi:Arc/MetJ family transcription regulator
LVVSLIYTIHMKRTNLVLNEQALETAKAMTGTKTYSEVVNMALLELIRKRTFAQIDEYASSGVWDGNLAEMRDDVSR